MQQRQVQMIHKVHCQANLGQILKGKRSCQRNRSGEFPLLADEFEIIAQQPLSNTTEVTWYGARCERRDNAIEQRPRGDGYARQREVGYHDT